MAYDFLIDDFQLPIAPSKVTTTIKNKNTTMDLINEGEVNIVKTAGLTEISFACVLPYHNYPFCVYPDGFKLPTFFLDKFEKLKTDKKNFQLIIARNSPDNSDTYSYTNMTVTLEKYTIIDDYKEGMDLTVELTFKQFKEYGTKKATLVEESGGDDGGAEPKDENPELNPTADAGQNYTIQDGDTLWDLAVKFYGDGWQYTKLLEANKDAIEGEAQKRGLYSSNEGWWIFTGTELIVPE